MAKKFSTKIITSFLLILTTAFFSSCSLKKGDMAIQQGASAFNRKEFDKAIGLFQMGLSVDTSYSPESVYVMIANCYSQMMDHDQAIEWRKKALEISEDPENYLNLGMIYRIKQDDDTAEQMFLKALELDDNNAATYASLGAIYITHNRIDEAIPLFKEAESISPRSGIIHADLAICYARKGDFALADEELEIAQDYKVDNFEKFKAEIDELRAKVE